MNFNRIKSLPNYDTGFKKLMLEEFEQFKSERDLKGINLLTDNLKSSNQEVIEQFNKYFLLRLQSKIENLLIDFKDDVFSDKNISPDMLTNVLDGLKKQIDIWTNKIKGEYNYLIKHKPKSLKLFCYELFFEYCNQLENFHNEYLQFLKRYFKNFDFSKQEYFVNLNQSKIKYTSIINESPLMTKNEVAKFLKVSVRQITNLENAKHLTRSSHVGNSPRYLRSEIEDYANIHRTNQLR